MATGQGGIDICGPEAGAGFATRLTAVGDLNNDGYEDFVLGAPETGDSYSAPNGPAGAGLTYIIWGNAAGLNNLDLTFSGGHAPDGLAYSVIAGDLADGGFGDVLSAAGDVNGDGIADLLIGASDLGGTGDAREAYVLYGHAGPWAALQNIADLGAGEVTRLQLPSGGGSGLALSGLGDVDGDGFDDILVQSAGNGAAYLLFGDGSAHPENLNLGNDFGDQKNTYTGVTGAAAAGDLNHDGVDDFLLMRDDGLVLLYGSSAVKGAGRNIGALTPNGTDSVHIPLAELRQVTALADINGDGIDDLLIEGRQDTLSGTVTSYILFGRTGSYGANLDLAALDGTNGFAVEGTGSGTGLGLTLGGQGDVNGDGLRDILLADAAANGDAGEIYLIFGRSGTVGAGFDKATLDGTNGYRFSGLNPGDLLGGAHLADVNGDGFADVLLAQPGRGGQGYLSVIYGGPERLRALDESDGTRDGWIDLNHLGDTLDFTEPTPVPVNGGGGVGSPPTQLADFLIGTDGADDVDLLAGNDVFQGKAGDDTLRGGLGTDVLYGDTGDDWLYGGADPDVLFGGAGPDHLLGEDGADALDGGAGNDILLGGAGADTLIGGLGDDLYQAIGAGDVLEEISNGGRDRVEAEVSFALPAHFEELILTLGTALNGTGNGLNNRIWGNNANNLLVGLSGSDSLYGGLGNDTLYGGGGGDTLVGSAGADRIWGGAARDVLYAGGADGARDTFVYTDRRESLPGPLSRDAIGGFIRGEDRIDLHALDANLHRGGNQAFAFSGTAPRAYAAWWVPSGSGVILRADMSGDGRADFEIRLSGVARLSASDLWL